jgi:hypothetical protein
MKLGLTIANVDVDLFDDETVVLKKGLQDVRDLSKQFSDYTQSFSVPASASNNQIFSYFYNVDVDGSFDQHNKVSATIQFNGLDLIEGDIELISATIKGGRPESYNVVFYGGISALSTVMGEDTLNDIDFSDLDHALTYTNVIDSWTENLFSGDVIYPLFDTGRNWIWSLSLQNSPENIFVPNYSVNQNKKELGGVFLSELKPAIRLPKMLELIFEHYGLTLSGNWLTAADTEQMYVHPQRDAGVLKPIGVTNANFEAVQGGTVTLPSATWTSPNFTSENYDNSNAFNLAADAYTSPYTGLQYFSIGGTISIDSPSGGNGQFRVKVNGTVVATQPIVVLGTSAYLSWVNMLPLNSGDVVTWEVGVVGSGVLLDCTLTSVQTLPSMVGNTVNTSELFPPDKVSEFVSKALKTFNLVLEPLSAKEFLIQPLEGWYDAGDVLEIDEFVDIKSIDVQKTPIFKSIDFKHKENKAGTADVFKEVTKRDFGSLTYEPEVDFASDKLEIESPFNVPVPSELNILNAVGQPYAQTTGILTHKYVDSSGSGIGDSMSLVYFNGLKHNVGYYIQNGFNGSNVPSFTVLYRAPNFSIFNKKVPDAASNSLAFGLEQPVNSNDIPLNTLYERFYADYLARIYDRGTKILVLDAVLPMGEFMNIRLNAALEYQGHTYIINNMSYDFMQQKARLELLKRPQTVSRRRIGGLAASDWEVTFDGIVSNKMLNMYNLKTSTDGKYYASFYNGEVVNKTDEQQSRLGETLVDGLLETPLVGFQEVTPSVITESDTIISALQKLQAQINGL